MTDKLSGDTVNIRIPKRLKEQLRKRAEEELSTMSQVVRKILAKEFRTRVLGVKHDQK